MALGGGFLPTAFLVQVLVMSGDRTVIDVLMHTTLPPAAAAPPGGPCHRRRGRVCGGWVDTQLSLRQLRFTRGGMVTRLLALIIGICLIIEVPPRILPVVVTGCFPLTMRPCWCESGKKLRFPHTIGIPGTECATFSLKTSVFPGKSCAFRRGTVRWVRYVQVLDTGHLTPDTD